MYLFKNDGMTFVCSFMPTFSPKTARYTCQVSLNQGSSRPTNYGGHGTGEVLPLNHDRHLFKFFNKHVTQFFQLNLS